MGRDRKEITIKITWDKHTTKNHVGLIVETPDDRVVGSHMIFEVEERFKDIIEMLKEERC